MNEVRNVLVGFVLGQNESQISYYDRRAGEPVQVPTKLGTNLFGFPTALAKVPGKDEWHFGHEAALAAKEKGAELIPSLYQRWCGEEPVTVDGEEHTPGNLLAIYLRRSLALLGLRDILRSISFMMFTTEVLSEGFVRNLRAALKEIGFSQEQCGMQDFKESFYYYTYHQTEDFFQANVALFLFERDRVVPLILSEDRQVRPRAVTIVLASEGYPGSYPKGRVITGLDAADGSEDLVIFHAGTKFDGDNIVTSGGRVLGASALGKDHDEARAKAYELAKKIHFDGAHFRNDIGLLHSTEKES